jgi:predicted regulator of amino acid metabolism with ACT domain
MGVITQKVWNFLENEPTIKRNLHRKIINQRALAKYIINKTQLNIQIDSVISAIRRFELSKRFNDYFYTIAELLHCSEVDTRTNLTLITIKNTNLKKIIKDIQEFDNFEKIRVLKGDTISKIIIDKNKLDSFKSNCSNKDIININDNIGEIKLILTEKAKDKKGVLAKIASELASYNINIYEIMSCLPELLFYIEEKNLPKAQDIIIRLCNRKMDEVNL